MDSFPIFFFNKGVDFQSNNTKKISEWIFFVISIEKKKLNFLNLIFTTDNFLYEINVKYLNHDFYTDIITFNNSENSQIIEGDIFISIERVKENSFDNKITFSEELNRIIIHGVLHLIGFDDSTPEQKQIMTSKENFYLNLLKI